MPLTVVDAQGARHRLVLRRWARPGWEVDDPDFTAQREANLLNLLAPTAVPRPDWWPSTPKDRLRRPALLMIHAEYGEHQALIVMADGRVYAEPSRRGRSAWSVSGGVSMSRSSSGPGSSPFSREDPGTIEPLP